MKRVHKDDCHYHYGHECECGMNEFYHEDDCPWKYGHDCECGYIKHKKGESL